MVSLDGGTYACVTCTYPFKVAADGAFHPVTGNPYVDRVAVTVVDPNTVRLRTQKAGKLLVDDTRVLSPDGATLVATGIDTSIANGTPIRYRDTMKRVGAPRKGHRLSGSWRAESQGTQDEAGLTFMLAVSGKQVTYTTPTGEKLEGTIGGPAVAWVGDQAGAMGAISMPTPAALRFVTSVEGKPVGDVTLTLAADGRTITITSRNLKRGTTSIFKAVKA